MSTRRSHALGAFWASAVVLAGVLGPSSPAVAQSPEVRGQSGVTVFSSDQRTTIYSPFGSVGVRLPENIDIDVAWEADVISSASVDVVTAATGRISELRNELSLTVARESILEDLDVRGSYSYSFEKDAFSHTGTLGVRQGFFQDNLELGVQYAFSYNSIGLVTDASDLWNPLVINNLDVDVVVLLDSSTQLDLVYSGAWFEGYQQSPYRRVPINWRTDLRGAQWLDEQVPDTRIRHAFTARVRRAFAPLVLAYLDYRFYVDSWSVIGHTVQLKVAVRLGDALTFQVRARGTYQGAASFYRRSYEVPTTYRTRDRRLSSHLSGLAGGSMIFRLGSFTGLDALNLRLAVDGVVFQYDDFMEPVLTPTGDATQETLGWVFGMVAQASLGVEL